MARTPKPPTPASVSATLRAAGYRAIGKGDEGYEVLRDGDTVSVEFFVGSDEADHGSSEGNERVAKLHALAIEGMERALRHKGWLVKRGDLSVPYLIVSAA